MNDVSPHPAIGHLLDSGELALECENKSPRTVGNYLEGLRLSVRWLEDRHPDIEDPGDVTSGVCRDGRPMNWNSVLQMLRRRGRETAIAGLHPRMFRHTFADRRGRGDLMELNGWRSGDMFGRYA